MLIRKFDRDTLESEPHQVLFKDIYPWDEIDDTPFGASLAVIEPGGETMVHDHNPAETFVICQGRGTMVINEERQLVAAGDVVYLPPGSVHHLKNDSDSEPLMFLSVFWDAVEDDFEEGPDSEVQPSRLIFPSPPTPNGPLHVGHLAGPYLLADTLRRFDRLTGRRDSKVLCLTDDHQSYIAIQAEKDGVSFEQARTTYTDRILATLQSCHAKPDYVLHTSQDSDYRGAVQDAYAELQGRGLIRERDQMVLECKECQHELFDGFLLGDCPHCGSGTLGFACENCCLPHRPEEVHNPTCTRCGSAATLRGPEKRWYLFLEPFRERLTSYHAQLELPPKLRQLAARYLNLTELSLAATAKAKHGIPVPGNDDLVISPWLELSLANRHLRHRYAEVASEVTHAFGYDNAFCYLVCDPAVSLALDADSELPNVLAVNEYLSLNDHKMSTSAGHYLSPDSLLEKMPADFLRFYLALMRPEFARTDCSLESMAEVLNHSVIERWRGWLAGLGESVAQEFSSKAPSADRWAPEHARFVAEIIQAIEKAYYGYSKARLQEVAKAAIELVDRATIFSYSQSFLSETPSLAPERATGVALELAAARTFAMIVSPLMPDFSAQLWKILGFRSPIEEFGWNSDPQFLPPGQRVLASAGLASGRLFPPVIDLSELIEA